MGCWWGRGKEYVRGGVREDRKGEEERREVEREEKATLLAFYSCIQDGSPCTFTLSSLRLKS